MIASRWTAKAPLLGEDWNYVGDIAAMVWLLSGLFSLSRATGINEGIVVWVTVALMFGWQLARGRNPLTGLTRGETSQE
jgi:hypothetical protein